MGRFHDRFVSKCKCVYLEGWTWYWLETWCQLKRRHKNFRYKQFSALYITKLFLAKEMRFQNYQLYFVQGLTSFGASLWRLFLRLKAALGQKVRQQGWRVPGRHLYRPSPAQCAPPTSPAIRQPPAPCEHSGATSRPLSAARALWYERCPDYTMWTG